MVQQASPVAHLFQSNQAPTEIEIALIQETIRLAETVDRPDGSEPSKDVITLADELKRAHIALLSPLRRLPPEILGLIFEAVIVYPHFYSPPHLSQVCHSWREVAMSTPSLWKTIALNLRTPGPVNGFPSIPAQVSILDLRLQRARNSKIHVLLDVSELSHAEHPAFQKILDCSDRWHQAWISLPTSVIPLIDRIKGHLNALHALTLKVPGEEPFEVFQDVPLLRHVVIDAAQRPSLPWSQLESFEERNCIIVAKQRKIGLLASASTLQICWPRSLIIPTGFICTNLETLHVSFVSEAAHLNFFIRIQAPKLKELRVEKVSLDISQDISVMIRRGPSPCLLQRLMLNHVFFTPTPLTTLLCLLPELEELHINLPHRSNLQKFIFDPTIDVAPFVPKLRKLLLRVHSIQGYEDIIAQVVSSRCEALSTSTTGLQGTRPVIIILQFRHNSTRLRELKLLEGSLKDMPEAPKALLYQTAILETALCSRASIKEQRKAINKNFSSLMSSQIHVHHIYVRVTLSWSSTALTLIMIFL